jgi:flavin-dependent dehydrogenase
VPTEEKLEIDALVIGGGVQGLVVLRELRRAGFSTVLLENRQVGGGQTCHSQVLIHEGTSAVNPRLFGNSRKVITSGRRCSNLMQIALAKRRLSSALTTKLMH